MKRLISLLSLLSLLGLVAMGAYAWSFWQGMQKPLDLPVEGLTYTLKPGTSLRALAGDLARKEIIDNPWYLEVWARWVEPGGEIRAGEYRFDSRLDIPGLLAVIRSGRSLQHRFTVVEGSSVQDFLAQLENLGAKGLINMTIRPENFRQVFTELTQQSDPEGWIFPDTYHFSRGDTDRDLITRAYLRMKKTLEQDWSRRDKSLPLKTPYEALILASIVEKETGAAEERPKIAGVFIERLNKKMRLQTDPTVIYGMGNKYKGNISKADLKKDTPYNTYTRSGLPPTPIALPGGDAIHAVMHPENTGALYFVAKGGGRHYFSRTYKEHKRAVVKYLLGGHAKRYKGDQ